MKRVRFDNSGAIAHHKKLGRELTPDEATLIKLEGWLVGVHLCVQKPLSAERGYCLSLYPWGDKLSSDFFAKDDAVACAKQIDALDIPWDRMREIDIKSAEYREYVAMVRAVLETYEADGLMMPPVSK